MPVELQQRIFVAVPAIAIAVTFVVLGGTAFSAFLVVLGIVCLHELFGMFPTAHASRLAGYLGIVGLVAAADLGGRADVLLALTLTIPATFLLTLLQPRGGAPAIALTLLGLFWVGLGVAHAELLRELPHGAAILVNVLVATFAGDTGAYLGGRRFGRRPLAPSISPNKTVEGLVVGIIVGTFAGWAAGLWQDWLSGTDALILGAAVAVVAPLGDLFESYLKRDAGTKDTGRAFGAHGGALDRLDAVLFSVVVGYYVWRMLM
jgi:phosphatidate cytidylyltransferase